MNEILLINRIDHRDYSGKKQKIFFQIGGMNLPRVEESLSRLIGQSRLVEKDDIVFKYNGVELNILTQSIPILMKLMIENNLSLYSVYAIYDPKL
jgi:Fe-S cluster assembly iron-binding protein IscA